MTTRIELPPTPPSRHPQYDPNSIQMTQNTATTTQFHITFAFLPPLRAFNFSQENKLLFYIYMILCHYVGMCMHILHPKVSTNNLHIMLFTCTTVEEILAYKNSIVYVTLPIKPENKADITMQLPKETYFRCSSELKSN